MDQLKKTVALVVIIAMMLSPQLGSAQSLLDGFELKPNSSGHQNDQLFYMAVLLASGMMPGPMELNILPMRGACNVMGGTLTEEYEITYHGDDESQIEYIYSFGELAYLTLTSEIMKKNEVISTRRYEGAIPEGIMDATSIPFSNAKTIRCTLTVASPYNGDMFTDVELVIFDVSSEANDW